jgi:hypothetical protein
VKKNAQRKYKCLVLRRDKSYVVKQKLSDSTKKFSGTDIKKMIETIPSTEINVNDKNVNAEYLRPNSATPFESLKPTLIIRMPVH